MSSLFFLVQFVLYFFAFLCSLLLCIYLYFSYSFTYWKRKGFPYLKPSFPLGNNDCIGYEALSYGLETVDWYNEIKRRGLKFAGAWSFANPVVVLADPEHVKAVLLKDFNHFTDRDFFHNPHYDPINESIFVVENEKWRNLRQKLSPVFTSAKMKTMFQLVLKCSEPMLELFEKCSESGDNMDIKEVVAMFTTDVIGCVAFGLDFGSFNSHQAKFRLIGKKFFESDLSAKIRLTLCRANIKLAQLFGIGVVPKSVTEFFTEVITENARLRQESNIKKPDLMQMLLDLHESTKGEENAFTFENFIGNVVVFFVAGFDTSSTTMAFALYELARNPDLQQRTREEIATVLEKHGGNLTYEAFQDMTYLRQVTDETLRLYPPLTNLARFCVKPYTFQNSNLTVEKGVSVVIPLAAFGRDPEYFPDPERFDPERFNATNKEAINKFAYVPFGEGPRNCIGKRFGIMQSAIGLIKILQNYKVSISPQTKMPQQMKHGVFLMQPTEKLYLNISKI